jgi:predicted permease
LAEDDVPGAEPAVVISHALWQRRFESRTDIVGSTVTVDGRQAVVVGVAPNGFRGLSFDTEIWTTLLPFEPDAAEDRGSRWLTGIGRLRPGIAEAQAQADLWNAARRLEERFSSNTERSADLVGLQDFYLGTTRTLLFMLVGAVSLLLLIACVNVVNLQIMRGIGRRGEVALRYALGAGRAALFRQLLIEAFVLACLGGIAGVALALAGTKSLVALIPEGVLPGFVDPAVDARVLLFAGIIIAIAGALSSVLPALRSTGRGLSEDLRARSGGMATGRAGTGNLQRSLVTVEVALAVALLGGAALMVRSLAEQLAVPPGFEPENVLVARISLPDDEYRGDARVRFADQLIRSLETSPGVTSVAIGSDAPLRGYSSASLLQAEGRPNDFVRYYRHHVTPGYFESAGIEMVMGRGFEPSDVGDAESVVIVGKAFAEKIWPGQDPVGRYIQIGPNADGDRAAVVGVAENVRFRDLTTDLFSPGEDPDVYFPYAQLPTTSFEILVRSGTSELPAAEAVRRAVAGLDPSVPLASVQPLENVLESQTASTRLASTILALFAVLAVVLSGIGLYGVMAFFVASRRSEIAVRIAVGAGHSRVLGMIVRQAMALVGIGIVVGLAVVLVAGELFSSVLYGVGSADPAVHLSSIALLALIAFLACAMPAWRAIRIDPTEALRSE